LTRSGGVQTLPRVFYGWRIVGVAFLAHFVSVGFVFYSYGVLFKALAAEFGGSRLGVGAGLALMSVASGLVSPRLGRVLDRGSIRLVMCAGALLLAAGFVLFSRITALWQFYALLGTLFAVGSPMMGGLAGSTLVSNWFVERRGTALGVAATGISLSGLVMAPTATRLVAEIGWRKSVLLYAAATLVLVLPAVWLVVVNRPEDLGLEPDGDPARHPDPRDADPPVLPLAPGDQLTDHARSFEWSARFALADRNFWVIALAVALNFAANGAMLVHVIPHATDVGFDPLHASYLLSTMAGCGVAGKLAFGWLADRISKRTAFFLASGLQGIGTAAVLATSRYPGLLAGAAVFGLGMGGLVPLWGALLGAAFGRAAFGRVMGLMSPVMLPIQSLGIPFAGLVFDRTGSYDVAFAVFVLAYLASIAALAFLRLPDAEPGRPRAV
jgi:MFS family permease